MKPIYMKFTNIETNETFVTVHHTNLSNEYFLKATKKDSHIYGRRNAKCRHEIISKEEYDRVVSTTNRENKSTEKKQAA